jgi:hypothetical protein
MHAVARLDPEMHYITQAHSPTPPTINIPIPLCNQHGANSYLLNFFIVNHQSYLDPFRSFTVCFVNDLGEERYSTSSQHSMPFSMTTHLPVYTLGR